LFTTETQRGEAASFQQLAFSRQLLNESGQHPFDFDGIRSELFVKSCWKELVGQRFRLPRALARDSGSSSERSASEHSDHRLSIAISE
jgi:hypothetical protein